MTQREKILSILIGALVVLGGGQWIFNKYKAKLKEKQSAYDSLVDRRQSLEFERTQGVLAARQMGEYLVRSVSSDTEAAETDYQSWVTEVLRENDLSGISVIIGNSQPVADLFEQLTFTASGTGTIPEIISTLHAIQAKDYLHRIRIMDIRRAKTGADYTVKLTLDVASLFDAPEEPLQREGQSWRVDRELVTYSDPILNRNLFEPPNGAPELTSAKTLTATRGRTEAFSLTTKDPEKHNVRYELVSPVDDVTLDENSGTLRVSKDQLTEFNVQVRLTDDGYPKRIVEETLLVKVVDPPPPAPKEEPKVELKFDDAKQTYLTGLVTSGDDWMAWMNVRTRGKTLKLRAGDEFEIGSVKGKVNSITADAIELQIGDRTVTMKQNKVALKSAVDG